MVTIAINVFLFSTQQNSPKEGGHGEGFERIADLSLKM
jgi:hypothetical protein